MDDLLRVGVIASAHGIRGEVNVYPTTDEPDMFPEWDSLVVTGRNYREELEIEQVKYFKQMVILKFKGVDDRNKAESMKNLELYIHRSQSEPCGENENFIADIIGLKVVEEDGSELGVCTDVMQTGANDVYEIELKDGRKVLFPAIPSCILDVDLEKNIMTVHVMDGLI